MVDLSLQVDQDHMTQSSHSKSHGWEFFWGVAGGHGQPIDISVRCDITSQNWNYLPETRPLCGKTKLLIHRQEMLEEPEGDVRKI